MDGCDSCNRRSCRHEIPMMDDGPYRSSVFLALICSDNLPQSFSAAFYL